MEVSSTAPNFPVLGIVELEDLTLGVFQVKQAVSYANEHVDQDGEFEILVSTETEGMLMASIQSKHSNRKVYKAIITYNSVTALEWACQCPNGNQAIGCCSHVASILWYLGHARYLPSSTTQRCASYIDAFIDAKSAPSSSSEASESDDETLYSLT
ncbi:unnamed protein product, partial [Rotaria sp. Silwood2]